MSDRESSGRSGHVARVLDDALISGLEVTFVVTNPDGTSVPSGTRIADARAYELARTRDPLRPAPEEARLEIHLIAEKARVPEVEEALIRLFDVAERDTGQSRVVADFLLAWWNAHEHGGFDVAGLFSLDTGVARDIASVVTHLSRCPSAVYADAFGHRERMARVIAAWRRQALEDAS